MNNQENEEVNNNLEDDSALEAGAADDGDGAITLLRGAVEAVNLRNSLSAPLRQAVEELLRITQRSINSDGASVLIRDVSEGGLRFMAAISKVKDELMKLRIPPGKGIAGMVFSTGQPIAVADAAQEGSFWSEADKRTNFKTITLLATPLRAGGELIGVLQFVNRPGEPPYPPFTSEEMDQAAYFAHAIAKLVEAYESALLVEGLFERWIKTSLEPLTSGESEEAGLRAWLEKAPAVPRHRDMLALGVTLHEIVNRGDAQRKLCREVLEALARFTKRDSASSGTYMGF